MARRILAEGREDVVMNALEMVVLLPCRCNGGWMCHRHADSRFLHDRCPGPGIPCSQQDCPYWQGAHPLAREPRVQFAYIFTLREMMRNGVVHH